MRILYLQQLLILPGCSRNNRSFELAQKWAAAGHKVDIICSTAPFPSNHTYFSPDKFPLHFHYHGLDIHVVEVAYDHKMPFWRRLWAFMAFFIKAYRLGKTLKDKEVILAYSAPLSVGELGRRLARYHRIPWVFEVADVWPDVPISMGIIKHPLLISWLYRKSKRMYQEAGKIVTFSAGMRTQILKHGISPSAVEVIYNGANVEHQPYISRSFGSAKQKRVLYAGTIGIANGLSQLIEAASLISSWGRHEIAFTILGEGNELHKVKALAQEKGLKNIRFLSSVPREEVQEILAQADIGVISFAPYPALEANGATKFFDYLANGLPIVINYEGWQAAYMKKYSCGLSSPQGDIMTFAQHILKLADDPDLCQKFSENGRRLLEEKFDRKLLAQQTLEAMEEVLRKATKIR